MIHHSAEFLATLHDAGLTHRNVKPHNILWLPRENRWTLIDFACVARIGYTAPLMFTLKYAAPEVIRARQAMEGTIVADEAMDAWSLGVVAVELFGGEPVLGFDKGFTAEEVRFAHSHTCIPMNRRLAVRKWELCCSSHIFLAYFKTASYTLHLYMVSVTVVVDISKENYGGALV